MRHSMLVRVITRAADGNLRIRDYANTAPLLEMHTQIGIDDCSADLGLRGLPIFRELIGPILENDAAQYETPEVFEMLTREWARSQCCRRHRRRRTYTIERWQHPQLGL